MVRTNKMLWRVSDVDYLVFIISVTVVLHLLLGIYSGYPDGYVYDFYSEAIILFHDNGRLASPDECWVCYHPPLLPYLGSLVFSLGELLHLDRSGQLKTLTFCLNAISMLFLYLSYKTYLLFRVDNGKIFDIAVLALLCFLPVVVISSHAIEADVLLSTLLVSAIYFFKKYSLNNSVISLLLCAVSLGLASLTKYAGALVAVTLGCFMLYRWLQQLEWVYFRNGLIFALVVIAIGSAPYINNFSSYGTPFKGNAAWSSGDYSDLYNFTNFSLTRIVDTFNKSDDRALGDYPVYSNEYISSHYGQLWTDHSFFTVQSRHGQPHKGATFSKDIPIWLVWAVLISGIPVTLIAMLGGIKMLRLPDNYVLIIISIVCVSAYIAWTFGNHSWMLKTKYFLYLVPLFLIALSHPFKEKVLIKNIFIFCASGLSCIYGFSFALT